MDECYRVDIRFLSGSTLTLVDNVSYGRALQQITDWLKVHKEYARIYEKRLVFKLQTLDGVRFQLMRIETNRQTRTGQSIPDKAGLCALFLIVNKSPDGKEDYQSMLREALENAK